VRTTSTLFLWAGSNGFFFLYCREENFFLFSPSFFLGGAGLLLFFFPWSQAVANRYNWARSKLTMKIQFLTFSDLIHFFFSLYEKLVRLTGFRSTNN
jgi:hypothetical protein